MESQHLFFIVLSAFVSQIVNAQLSLEGRSTNTFDLNLYEQALDKELCAQQVEYIQNNSMVLLNFWDASARIPNGILTGSLVHFGNYFQCLDINEDVPDMKIEGKYCLIDIPFQQDIHLPFNQEFIQNFQSHIEKLYSEAQNVDRSSSSNLLGWLKLSLGICIPKACTTNEWLHSILFNVSVFGFEFEEKYCRLPNDKPFVAADYVSIVIFSILGVLIILGTGYDVCHTHILKRDPKDANVLYRTFSVYTNTRRLLTFTSNPNALDCLDGMKSISMIWVVIAHTYSSLFPNMNYLDQYNWLISVEGVWVPTGFFAVDTFFTTAGVLLVYTTMGKMNGMKLLKNLPAFYLNRILRMLPLLAALILLQASLFHQVADGPYWQDVAKDVERCRHFWWSTLLYVQNYVNPHDICLPHTWYLAIDMQLYFLSPIVLFWVLRGRRSAIAAFVLSVLAVLTAATVYIFMNNFTSSFLGTADEDLQLKYYAKYYVNTLVRASPFLIGMVYGYILSILRGHRLQIKIVVVLCCWVLALGILALAFYTSYMISGRDWDNQLGDNLVNSFMRPGWAMALGWIIIACVKGYGGPINWFLSLDIWKFFSRMSYAMYLYHYPLLFIVTGTTVTPSYFSAGSKVFEFLGIFTLSLIVSFVVTVVVDAPFSILIKMIMQGGGQQKPKPLQTVQNTNSEIIGRYTKGPAV